MLIGIVMGGYIDKSNKLMGRPELDKAISETQNDLQFLIENFHKTSEPDYWYMMEGVIQNMEEKYGINR